MKICVYGASSSKLREEYYSAATQLGRLIAQGGHSLVFGGGQGGLMGACAAGAFEQGGEIIGIAPRFFDEPGILFQGCTRFIYTQTMRERKQAMEQEAEAFIAMPGGIGTFEEFFEIFTLKQLGQHTKPIVLLNTLGYFEPMLSMLEKSVEAQFMSRSCLKLISCCQSPQEALEQALHAAPLGGSIKRLSDYSL